MNLIVIRKNANSSADNGNDLLRFAVSSEPIASIFFDGLSRGPSRDSNNRAIVVIPEEWGNESCATSAKKTCYSENVPVPFEAVRKIRRNLWFIISNGRFVTQIDRQLLNNILAGHHADVVTVNVEPELLAGREKVRLTSQGKVAGFRRLYSDSAQPTPIPSDWPDHVFARTNILDKLIINGALPLAFAEFIDRCQLNSLTMHSIDIGGIKLDLETETGLMSFLASCVKSTGQQLSNGRNGYIPKSILKKNGNLISDTARLFGNVILGKNVRIHDNTIVLGPTIFADNVTIGNASVIQASVIGPDISVPPNQIIQHRVLNEPSHNWKHGTHVKDDSPQIKANRRLIQNNLPSNHFRAWPRMLYARCLKRIVDIVAAAVVLALFAPILPIMALAIKLSSRGPIFFRDKRQGLHGKEFYCLKLRTMIVGADKIQDKLRVMNQVDGPQFKIKDDPRLNSVGRFLRDTYFDEIPQFLNVLLGQMSVVGPRPSPEAENTLCPAWRDARLSVRPGITGLWQICGTRQPMKDFQEWIHYDIKYVRELSLKLDLWICFKTVKKLIWEFARQF